jgi:epoxide hydrolase 4
LLSKFVYLIVIFVNMKDTHQPPTIVHSMASGAGVNLHVARFGQGSPVLLLHGFPDHWRLWEPMMLALGDSHHLMAPDLRGYNLSDKPDRVEDYHIDCLVQDARALIAQLGGRCAVVGHDWGGMLAWALAARYPKEISKLVIFNAPHPCRFAQQLRVDPAQRAASDYVRRLCASEALVELTHNNFERLWAVVRQSTTAQLSRNEKAACVQAWAQSGALPAMLNWYRAVNFDAAMAAPGVSAVPDLGGASGKIEVPTLVVWGENDGSFPVACLAGLSKWVPDLQIHRVPECGHWLLREQPAVAAALLVQFLK